MRRPASAAAALTFAVLAGSTVAAASPTTATAPVALVSYLNPGLVQVESVDGKILDVSRTQVLYLDGTTSPSTLKIVERGGGPTVSVPTVPGAQPSYARLTSNGAVFQAATGDSTTSRIYDWPGGAEVIDLGPLNSGLDVAGDYVVWSNRWLLTRRNVVTGETITISENAGNVDFDVLPDGDVVFWTLDYQIQRYHDGATEQLTHDTELWNTYPISSGANVVYRKTPPCCDGGTGSIMLHDGAGEILLGTLNVEPQRGDGYDLAGDWAAFKRSADNGEVQIWRRAPDGNLTQVTDVRGDPGNAPRIINISGSGEVLYDHLGNLYRSVPDHPPELLVSGAGVWLWRDFGYRENGDFALSIDDLWTIAVGGILYILSDQPPVALTLTVTGHGTISTSPYGTSCRSVCSEPYQPGVLVTLTATADLPGWRFLGWNGACTGNLPRCELRLDATTSVGASFEAADTTAPVVTLPRSRLRLGTELSSGVPPSVPLLTEWAAHDPDGTAITEELQVSVNGGGYAPVSLRPGTSGIAWTTVVPTAEYRFRARATDTSGNVSDWSVGEPFVPLGIDEQALTYTGQWRTVPNPSAWGGTIQSTTDPLALATATVSGREIAVVGPTGLFEGAVQVYVDGIPEATTAPSGLFSSQRRILAVVDLNPGPHVVHIVRAPSAWGPAAIDGLIILS